MIKNKQVLCLDIDQVLFPLIETIIGRYNKRYKDNVKVEDLITYEVSPYIKPECKNLFQEFGDRQTFETMAPYPNAIEAVEYLNQKYKVYYVSAAHPYTVGHRDDMLSKWFQSYKSRQLIILREKQMLRCDALVDDNYDNLVGGDYAKFLMDFPWNKQVDENQIQTKRVFGWNQETLDVIDEVMKIG